MMKPKDDRPYMHNSTFRVARQGLNKVNWDKRNRRSDEDLVKGSHHRAIMTFPCALADDPQKMPCASYTGRAPIEGHHLKTVGSGGQDRDNEIPVCNAHHDECHRAGDISSQCERFKRDLRSLACEYTKRVDLLLESGPSVDE